jgi:polyisoprenoid-binding protein YceI
VLFVCLAVLPDIYAQGFKLPARGVEEFHFKNDVGRNQARFISEARYEIITGITNNVWGEVSFDINDIKNSLKGEVNITVSSLRTGIALRDEHLCGAAWLNAEKYPEIKFVIKDIQKVIMEEDNRIKVYLIGEFSLRGRTKLIYSVAEITYQEENEFTKTIMLGNLINVKAELEIFLSDFGVTNSFIGNRVSNKIEIVVTLIGSN